MITTSVSLSVFIDLTLGNLYRLSERPAAVSFGGLPLDGTSVTFTLAAGQEDVGNPGDVFEFGSELVYVTARTTDTTPVLTCTRGYLGTPQGAYSAGSVGYLNPPFPRYRVAQGILSAFIRLNSLLPNISSQSYFRTSGLEYVELPSDTLGVYEVGYLNTVSGRYWELPNWHFVDDLPQEIVASGKLLRTPGIVSDPDRLIIKRRVPYAWSDAPPNEFSFVSVPIGAEDLPPIYAAALLVSRREIGRLELDNSEEWNKLEVIRAGSVNMNIVKDLWQQFYRGVDEVKRIYQPPRRREFRKRPRFY